LYNRKCASSSCLPWESNVFVISFYHWSFSVVLRWTHFFKLLSILFPKHVTIVQYNFVLIHLS
jgi:hypothetical protein